MSNLLENIQNISRKINEKFYLNLSDFELDLLRK
jgi:hypothetical protein